MSRLLGILLSGSMAALAVGCGGNASTAPQSAEVTFTFVGATPSVLATQIGTGPLAIASLQGENTLTLLLPGKTSNYTLAYVCPTVEQEFVVEANAQDGDTMVANCTNFSTPPLAAATGSVNASAIPGATQVIVANSAPLASVGVSGSFSALLPSGNRDIVFLAENGNGVVLGVKILRSQTVPGAVNGGGTVVFAPTDVTTQQPVTINNVPSGSSAASSVVQYVTIGGTDLFLEKSTNILNGPAGSYPAVPVTETQSGDFYFYQSTASVTGSEEVGALQSTTSGGGPVTLTLPAPWSFGGPAPSALPTFTFNYSGFVGLPAVSQQARIGWVTPTILNESITVTATASFQNGATTLAFPDLTSVNGFLAPPSGVQISWSAEIFGGTAQAFNMTLPGSNSVAFVRNQGTYTQP
jgi:hypothetical protein